jgi:hypothetical protein
MGDTGLVRLCRFRRVQEDLDKVSGTAVRQPSHQYGAYLQPNRYISPWKCGLWYIVDG